MIRNYLKTALRNLWKHSFYSSINLIGLSSGIVCFLLIVAFIRDELKFDHYHEKSDRIVRINFEGKFGENILAVPKAGAPVGSALLAEMPEVEDYTRFREVGESVFQYEDQSFREDELVFADSNLLDFFDFELIYGDKDRILRKPNTAVITKKIANKYFGNEDPVGKVLKADDGENILIDGVINDLPEHSHLQKDIFISMSSHEGSRSTLWTDMNFYTFLLLQEGASIESLSEKLPRFLRLHVGVEIERFLQKSFDDFLETGNFAEYNLLPLTDIYLRSPYNESLGPSSDIRYLYIFGAVAIIILLLASINFINLATARASTRSLEVGVRKVVGANRSQLITQFISESSLLALFSLATGLLLAKFILPFFNNLTHKSISFSAFWKDPFLISASIGLALFIGLIAGAYPSLYLTRFRPITAMQGESNKKGGGQLIRNGLVVFQFAMTTILLIGTLTVYQQMEYIQNKKLGFEKEQLMIINNTYAMGNKLTVLKETLTNDPRIKNVASTSYLPTPSDRNTSSYFYGSSERQGPSAILQYWFVNEDFIPTLGLDLIAGENFTPTDKERTTDVIINEQAIKRFGIKGDVIGQQLNSYDGIDEEGNGNNVFYTIIGVVKNFHFESFHHEIEPLVLHQGQSNAYLLVKAETTEITDLIKDVEDKWSALGTGLPFEYSFMDDNFINMYQAEARMNKISGLFSILSIIIACIGLLGIATFTAAQRQKEISIRKVLGASIGNLFLLQTKNFGKLIILSFLFGIPFAWYLMKRWLESFVYASPLSSFNFFITALLLLFIGLIAVGYQAVRTANCNPAEVLKRE